MPGPDNETVIGHSDNLNHPTHDMLGRPRPGSGSQADTVGALERSPFAEINNDFSYTGIGSWKLTNTGVEDFPIAITIGIERPTTTLKV